MISPLNQTSPFGKMERNEETKKILELSRKFKNLLLILPTGFGKTKIAIDLLKSYGYKDKILIVIPRLVLIENWKAELKKWRYKGTVEFTTYISLYKHIGNWNCIIFDECHHFTEKCAEIYPAIHSLHSICLSGTVKKEQFYRIKDVMHPYMYRITMRNAIDNEILPDPTVLLYPIDLTIKQYTEYSKLSREVDKYKDLYMRKGSQALKNLWLHNASIRLNWLSMQKTEVVSRILWFMRGYRTITFCNNIAQTEMLGKNCINSKNKDSATTLASFNNGKIKHLTACNMLNEGRHTCPYLSNSVSVI